MPQQVRRQRPREAKLLVAPRPAGLPTGPPAGPYYLAGSSSRPGNGVECSEPSENLTMFCKSLGAAKLRRENWNQRFEKPRASQDPAYSWL